MSRLSRLRSFWRSLRRGTVRDGSYALRLWRLLRSATWEEWTAGLWIGFAPAFFHWYAFAATPLALGLIWRGSERRIRRQDAQSRHDADSYRPHAAVNLLPQEYRDTGGHFGGGLVTLSASTGTKEHGTRTPETATTVGCSSLSRLGWTYTVADYLRMPPQGSSYFGRGFSGRRTAGGNPGRTRPDSAGCGEVPDFRVVDDRFGY